MNIEMSKEQVEELIGFKIQDNFKINLINNEDEIRIDIKVIPIQKIEKNIYFWNIN